MTEAELIGTWRVISGHKHRNDPPDAAFSIDTFEISGAYTMVLQSKGFLEEVALLVSGDTWRGKWSLLENGTVLRLSLREGNSTIGTLAKIMPFLGFITPTKHRIIRQDKDHFTLKQLGLVLFEGESYYTRIS